MHKQIKSFYDLASEYHISALVLWEQITDAPYLYNPICYLLRHTVELQLKGLIIKELKRDNRKLIVSEIKIDNKKMNSTHSLLILWKYYKHLLTSHSVILDTEISDYIDSVISKTDKKDFSSTRYRYPFDKKDKAINLFPVDIDSCGKAPDLALGVPTIIQLGDKVGVISKGKRLMKETIDLFNITELLFELIDKK